MCMCDVKKKRTAQYVVHAVRAYNKDNPVNTENIPRVRTKRSEDCDNGRTTIHNEIVRKKNEKLYSRCLEA